MLAGSFLPLRYEVSFAGILGGLGGQQEDCRVPRPRCSPTTW